MMAKNPSINRNIVNPSHIKNINQKIIKNSQGKTVRTPNRHASKKNISSMDAQLRMVQSNFNEYVKHYTKVTGKKPSKVKFTKLKKEYLKLADSFRLNPSQQNLKLLTQATVRIMDGINAMANVMVTSTVGGNIVKGSKNDKNDKNDKDKENGNDSIIIG